MIIDESTIGSELRDYAHHSQESLTGSPACFVSTEAEPRTFQARSSSLADAGLVVIKGAS